MTAATDDLSVSFDRGKDSSGIRCWHHRLTVALPVNWAGNNGAFVSFLEFFPLAGVPWNVIYILLKVNLFFALAQDVNSMCNRTRVDRS